VGWAASQNGEWDILWHRDFLVDDLRVRKKRYISDREVSFVFNPSGDKLMNHALNFK